MARARLRGWERRNPVPPDLRPSTREAHYHGLLADAVATCERRGEQPVLLVDGLDEDRGVTTGPDSHSVAALLALSMLARHSRVAALISMITVVTEPERARVLAGRAEQLLTKGSRSSDLCVDLVRALVTLAEAVADDIAALVAEPRINHLVKLVVRVRLAVGDFEAADEMVRATSETAERAAPGGDRHVPWQT